MLRHKSQINGYAIHASDGLIGSISDVLFDDATWLVRWLVVDTGAWLTGRQILLPPSALGRVNHIGHEFIVKLTRQQVRDCPDAGTRLPLSRQHEADIYNYYRGAPYSGAGAYLGMAGYGASSLGMYPISVTVRQKSNDGARRAEADPALRSTKEVTLYTIHASDGEIGHVADFLIEDDDWSIRYLVVDTGTWWPGNKVLVSPLAVRSILWTDRLVNLGADRQAVKDSAAYDPSIAIDPVYEKHIHKYSGDLRVDVIRSLRPRDCDGTAVSKDWAFVKLDPPRVDNHPKYSDWVRAMDELGAAEKKLETVRYLPEDNPVKQAARAEVWQAQSAYEGFSREIGY